MKHVLTALLAIFAFSGIANAQARPEQGERNIRQQQQQAATAAAAGQIFVEQFTASQGCEPGQEEVVNDSRFSSTRSSSYHDDRRQQNRRQVQGHRFRGQGLPAFGPSLRLFSRTDSRRVTICESK